MPYEHAAITPDQADAWNAFVAGHPLGRALITTFARERWSATGWQLHTVGSFVQGRLVAGAAVCTRKIPRLPWKLARIVAILPEPADIVESTLSVLASVREFARANRVIEAELRCMIPDLFPVSGVEYYAQVRRALEQAGYVASNIRQGTYIVPIDMDDAALLNYYSFKCRRDVRAGLKKGVEVKVLELPEDLQRMFQAAQEMRSRKGLSVSDAYCAGLEELFARKLVVLFGASYQDKLRNLYMVDVLGIPQPILAATTAAAFEKSTPPTGQLLQFRIMTWLRDRGAKYYDQGGSHGPVPIKGHPNYSVWRFKYEFNGTYVQYVPYYRRVCNSWVRLPLYLTRRLGRL